MRSSGARPSPARTAARTLPGRSGRAVDEDAARGGLAGAVDRSPGSRSGRSRRVRRGRRSRRAAAPGRRARTRPAWRALRPAARAPAAARRPGAGRSGKTYSTFRPVISATTSRVGVVLGGQPDGDGPAVLEHGDPVADAADLLQAVRDVDDGDAVGGEVADDPEEVVDLVGVEGGGRLVHHDQPYVVGERPGHGDDLLLGGGEVADRAAPGRSRGARGASAARRPRPWPRGRGRRSRRWWVRGRGRRSRPPTGPRPGRVPGRWWRCRGAWRRSGDLRVTGSPRQVIAPPSGWWAPASTLIRVDLPGAVLAEQAVDFAGLDVEVDAVEGADAGERLGDAGHGEQGWFWCHDESPRRMRPYRAAGRPRCGPRRRYGV